MSETIVWISGATGGIGSALLRHMPYKGARVINLDRQDAAGCENVRFDLLDPERHIARLSWWQRLSARASERQGAALVTSAFVGLRPGLDEVLAFLAEHEQE